MTSDHMRNDLMSDMTYITVKHLMSEFTWTMTLDLRPQENRSHVCLTLHAS